MSNVDAIRNLYEYNEWANNVVLEAASALGANDFARQQGTSWGSVEGNLAHLLAGQVVWLQRWTASTNPRSLMEVQSIRGFGAIRDALAESHATLREFVESLTEERLDSALDYTDSRGNPNRRLMWQLMAHLVNHGTQHRSETAVALTAMGHSPGDLDYGHFCDIRGSDSAGTLEMMRALYDYNEWANGHILRALEGLGDEELMQPRGVSHTSIGMDLLHEMGAQVGWLSTWQGGTPRIALPSTPSARFGDNLVDWFGRSHAAIGEFIAGLSDEALGETRADNPDGSNKSVKRGREMLLWDMMLHVVNHGTQHRSEAAMMLTEIGRSPGEIDYHFFEIERDTAIA